MKINKKKKYLILGTGVLGVSGIAAGTVLTVNFLGKKTASHPKANVLQNLASNITIMQGISGTTVASNPDPYGANELAILKTKILNKFIAKMATKLNTTQKPILDADVESWIDTTKVTIPENTAMNKSIFGETNQAYPYKVFTLNLPIKFSQSVIKINVIVYIKMSVPTPSTPYNQYQESVLNGIKENLRANKDGVYNISGIQNTTHSLFTTIDQEQKEILSLLQTKQGSTGAVDVALDASKPKEKIIIDKINTFETNLANLKKSLKEDFENQQKDNVKWIKDFLKITYPGQSGTPASIKSKLNLTIDGAKFNAAIASNLVTLDKSKKPSELITSLTNPDLFKFKSTTKNEMLNLTFKSSEINNAIKYIYTDIGGNESGERAMAISGTNAITFNIYKNHDAISKRLDAAMKVKVDISSTYKNTDISQRRHKLYGIVISKIVNALDEVYAKEYNQGTKRPYELKYIIELPSTGSGASLVKPKIEITKGLTQVEINQIVLAIEAADNLKAGTPPTLPNPIGDFIQEASTKKVYFEFKGDYKIIVNASAVKDYQQKALETRVDLNDDYDVITSGKGLKFEINTKIRTFAEKIAEVRKVFKLGLADDAYLGDKGTNSAPAYDDTRLKTALKNSWNTQFGAGTADGVEITNRSVIDSSLGANVQMKNVKIKKGTTVLWQFNNVVVASSVEAWSTYSTHTSGTAKSYNAGKLTWTTKHQMGIEDGGMSQVKHGYFSLKHDKFDGRYKLFNVQYSRMSEQNGFKYYGKTQDFTTLDKVKESDFYKNTTKPYFNTRNNNEQLAIGAESWYILDSLTGEMQLFWYRNNAESDASILKTNNKNEWTLKNGTLTKTFSISHKKGNQRGKMILTIS